MGHGEEWPPLPFLPCDVPVYFLGTTPGTTNLLFAYDDRFLLLAWQSTENALLMLGDENEGGSGDDTNAPPESYTYDYGTNLFLLIGPLTNQQAWLVLTNTHNGTFYQLESRLQVDGAPWELGEIVQDTGSSNQVQFSNVPRDYPTQRFFRGVGGATVASIALDPDYNLAVEPATSNGLGQTGKFRVFLNPPPSSSVVVVYQLSGSASNGVDYSSLNGSVTVEGNASSTAIEIHPLYDTLPEFDESVTLTLVLTNGYLVEPKYASATMKIYDPRPAEMAVAIHDSGWTRWFGLSSTNWNYFVLPESMKEALRSDGTPYVVVSDLDIATGALMTNGAPRYPILISLAAEAIREDEVAALTNYVAAGGFVLAGSSSFTRHTDGSFRTNFALASQMGLNCTPGLASWLDTYYLMKLPDQSQHRLVTNIPPGWLNWRMPSSAEEVSWGTHSCDTQSNHVFLAAHQIWSAAPSDATELAVGWTTVSNLYLASKPYGSGYFIYDAALQPLIGHGGFAPSMYAYAIFRRAIEWAFEAAQRPVVKLSPWPYEYDAAFMVRHDFENFTNEIANIPNSALFEYTHGAWGDYYFCTGTVRSNANQAAMTNGLRQAVTDYHATIGPHNGGLRNPYDCGLTGPDDYDYFHWGPDEALDFAGGSDYASNSLAISFADIEGWRTNCQTAPRLWVSPYFNATREGSYNMQEQLGVSIAGEQKLTPFPHWTFSTQTDGKRYAILSEPVSDWFVRQPAYAAALVAQSLEDWHPPGVHTRDTIHTAVDFYYGLGALINLYSHSSSDGTGAAGDLVPYYITNSLDASLHPRLWSTNAAGVYDWWLRRSAAQVVASYGTNGGQSVAAISIGGAQDANTAIELLLPSYGSPANLQVRTNGTVTTTENYRITGQLIRVRVGTSITSVQVQYVLGPKAQDDSYSTNQDHQLTVLAPGVLANDWPSNNWPGLIAINASSPQHGTVTLTNNGGFTYWPQSGFAGMDCFTYETTDGTNSFGSATVTIQVTQTGGLFNDDFTRCNGSLSPWQVHSGEWTIGGRTLQGSTPLNQYGYCYLNTNWTSYSVEASVRFPTGGFGGGVGGRLDPASGAHYAAWIYPEGSGGTNVLKLVKFLSWETWGTGGQDNHVPMAVTNLPPIGGDSHPLKLVLNGDNVDVYYHGTNVIRVTDTEAQRYTSGGVSLEMWTETTTSTMSVSNLVVHP
jgi:hypothetical protein